MKQVFLLFALAITVTSANAQKDRVDSSHDIEQTLFVQVEHPAEFVGGAKAFAKYVEAHLDQSVPRSMGAPAGVYNVKVQFIVDRDGKVNSVKALTNHGYEMEYTAEQLIKKTPKWKPARQNGHIVNYLHNVIITFKVE